MSPVNLDILIGQSLCVAATIWRLGFVSFHSWWSNVNSMALLLTAWGVWLVQASLSGPPGWITNLTQSKFAITLLIHCFAGLSIETLTFEWNSPNLHTTNFAHRINAQMLWFELAWFAVTKFLKLVGDGSIEWNGYCEGRFKEVRMESISGSFPISFEWLDSNAARHRSHLDR